jgi:hypothetical protein
VIAVADTNEAIKLVEYALHLRQHGERAPGGNETWREFDQRAEACLRGLSPSDGAGKGVARTELEVWRLAHRVGAEFVETAAAEHGLPAAAIVGARMYRDYVAQVMAAAGYPQPCEQATTNTPRNAGGER